jgi:hypothetical protein
MLFRGETGRGVKRNVTTKPAILGETHFVPTSPTAISRDFHLLSSCRNRSIGAVRSTQSCRISAFGLGRFKNRQIGALAEVTDDADAFEYI